MAKLHKFNLYGVHDVRITASTSDRTSDDFLETYAELDLEIEAPDDIEADLLAPALSMRGFTNDEVLQFREVLRQPEYLQKLKKLMLEPGAKRMMEEK